MTLAFGLTLGLTALSCSDLGVSSGSVRSLAAPVQAPQPTPGVSITSPARASFVAPGQIAVEGSVAEVVSGSPVTSLTVQGATVAIAADGTFKTTVVLDQGLNTIRAAATDAGGRTGITEIGVLAGDWLPLAQPVPAAVGLRVGDPALDAVASLLEPLAARVDLTPLTRSPIYDGALLGGLASAQVSIQNPRLTLTPPARVYGAPDGLHVEVDFRDLYVDLTAQGRVFGANLGPETAAVEADTATATATIELFLRPDRTVGVRMVQSSVDFVNFRATPVSGSALIALVLPLARGWIQTRTESLLAGKIVAFDATLDRVVQDALAPTAPIDIFGTPFLYAAKGESVIHDAGGLEVVVDFDAPPAQLTTRASAAPGSFSTPALSPPMLRSRRGVSLAIDDDLLNRALHSAWASGALDLSASRLTSGLSLGSSAITAADLARFLPEVLLAVPPSATLTIDLEAGLPPLLEVTGAPDLARLSLGELYLTVHADDGSGPVLLARVALSVRSGVTVALEPGAVRLTATQLAEVSVDVLEEPLVKIDAQRLRMVLGTVIPLVIPKLINKIGLVPVPSVIPPGMLRNLSATQDSATGQRLKIELDMIR